MLIKIAALGALGYAGYRYFTQRQGTGIDSFASRGTSTSAQGEATRIDIAGGPLSDSARVQHSPDAPTFGERPQL